MEVQSIVPNQFFDLFARIVPGGFFVFLLKALNGPDLLMPALRFFVPYRLQGDVIPWAVVVVGLAYTCGHMLSPLVKGLDRLGKQLRETEWYKASRADSLPLFQNVTERYNDLRFSYPARLTNATRIRAEYTMYGGLAAAIAVAEFVAAKNWLSTQGEPTVSLMWHLACLATGAGMIYRYFDVHKRFCETVKAFEAAAIADITAPTSDAPRRTTTAK